MKQDTKKSGRLPKVDASPFRCSVNFSAIEETSLGSMHEQSGVTLLSAIIKMQLFGKTFKVHYMDDNSRIFIDKHSSLNARYRFIGVEYDTIVKLIKQHSPRRKLSAPYTSSNKPLSALSNLTGRLWHSPTTSILTGEKKIRCNHQIGNMLKNIM